MKYFDKKPKDINNPETEMVSSFEAIQYENGWERTESIVVRESSLTIYFNDERIITLICSKNSKEYLAVGFLVVERFIEPEEVEHVKISKSNEEAIYIEAPLSKKAPCMDQKAITPGLGKGATFLRDEGCLKPLNAPSSLKIFPHHIIHLMKKLSERSTLYKLTHGVHNAAICTPDNLEVFQFDLGRHNAIDKLYGQCLMEKIPISEKIIITSGRVSSEIIIKAGRMGVPILISRSAPTDKAIRLAKKIGLTLIAKVRGQKMCIYTFEDRIVFD